MGDIFLQKSSLPKGSDRATGPFLKQTTCEPEKGINGDA
jgi:hypothetical protein